jgi:hypothetical protein
MQLECTVCGNRNRFTAEAKANINVIIDGHGTIINTRPGQQQYKDIVIIKPWKCNSCGSTGTIRDLDAEKKGSGEKP